MATGISTLGQSLNRIEEFRVQNRSLSLLTTQLTTGKKTQKYSGLGTDLLTSIRARVGHSSIEKYNSNIVNAERRIDQMLNAVEEFKAQSENFLNSMVNFLQESTPQQGSVVTYDDPTTTNIVEETQVGLDSADLSIELENLQDFAGSLFAFLTNIINVDDNGRYLLAGAASDAPPLGDTSTLDAAMSALIQDWKSETISTTDFISDLRDRTALSGNPNAITDSIVGFNATLSSGNARDVYVRVDDATEVEYTVLGNHQAFRDIMVGLAYLKNADLGPVADVYLPGDPGPPAAPSQNGAPGDTLDEMKENFFSVFNALKGMVSNAIDNIDLQRFTLESAKARIVQIRENNEFEQNLFLNTVADVEDADISEVGLKISQLQIQIEASYAVTAATAQLSLVNFL